MKRGKGTALLLTSLLIQGKPEASSRDTCIVDTIKECGSRPLLIEYS